MRPTPRCVLLLAAGLPLAALPALGASVSWWPWALWVGGVVLALLVDALLAVTPRKLALQLDLPARIDMGATGNLRIGLANAGRRPLAIDLQFETDEALGPVPRVPMALGAGETQTHEVRLRPVRRGEPRVRRAWLGWRGPWGLVEWLDVRDVDESVAVVPDVTSVQQLASRLVGRTSVASGARLARLLGEGREFESLQAYVEGHDRRMIDWRASARHRQLLVRNNRAERDQQVVLAIDTGALMAEPLDGMARLDHAINKGLLLSWMALAAGDRVALYAFDAKPRAWVPPQSGGTSFRFIEQATAGLRESTHETNFTLGLLELGRRLRRRSLVVVFTEFSDSVTAELMLRNIGQLARNHLIVFVALDDPDLLSLVDDAPDSLSDLHRAVVAADMRTERRVVLQRLRRAGVQVLDTTPADMSEDLLARYVEIRRRELVG